MASRFKKNDNVKVISGKNKGKIGVISKVLAKDNKVLLEGLNVIKKHVKPNKLNPEGGIVEKEMPIDVSNVMHLDPDVGVVTRVGFKFTDDGKKVRYFKKSGKLLDNKKI